MEELTPNTRYEKFLSAAAGSGSAPDPVTREEKFLKAIADNAGGGGSSLPTDPAQDGTYNLQNTVSSGTSTLSWASGSSGGGVLVVTDTDGTLNKTFKEINDASNSGCLIIVLYSGSYWYQGTTIDTEHLYMSFRQLSINQIGSTYYMPTREYVAESVNDYPVLDV